MDRFRYNPTHEPSARHELDPIGALVGWVTGKVVERNREGGYDLGANWWASPVLNAVDMEYRVRLNSKIEVLERQVERLTREVEEEERRRG
ncbi:hypothetical protein HDU67_001975, partial [Dinochytrium kinnereticum]